MLKITDDYDFTGKSEADILLSYTANKGHRTRQVNKVKNLLDLQNQKYSKTTEKTNYSHQRLGEVHR